MERLIEAGLFGQGLLPVSSPELVKRYNECLERLGLPPTGLSCFHIDGMGWSPEIASEKKDRLYLSAGIANPMAVILSPDQEGKPVYFPFNSYDSLLMQRYFEKFREEIASITASAGLAIEIDDDLTAYESPRDLLLVDYVIVRSSAGLLSSGAEQQRQLVNRFMLSEDAWQDQALRRGIIESAKAYGDLRFRKVSIPDMRFDEMRFFYTGAFKGVFIFKHLAEEMSLVVLEEALLDAMRSRPSNVYWACPGASLIGLLIEQQLADINLASYAEQPARLAKKRDYLVMDILSSGFPERELTSLTEGQKRTLLVELGGNVPATLHELERLIRHLASGISVDPGELSTDLQALLLHPKADLTLLEQEVVAQLIARLEPRDVLCLFRHDRSAFYDRYLTWPRPRREWAIQTIMSNGGLIIGN